MAQPSTPRPSARADELLLTQVTGDFGCTKFFPPYLSTFALHSKSEEHQEGGVSYRFETWRPLDHQERHDLPAGRRNTLVPVALISYSRRLTSLAEQDPDRPAITCGDRSVTRSELESAANRLARDLLEGGATEGDMITVALPNSVEWFIAFAACWKIGAVPQPVSARLPERELRAILELADPSVVIGVP